MTPDNSNISPLFGDISQTPSTPLVPPVVPASDIPSASVSSSVSGIFASQSDAPSASEVVPPQPVAPPAKEVPISPAATRVSEVMAATPTNPPETINPPVPVSSAPIVSAPVDHHENDDSEDQKLQRYMEQDLIYQSMLRVTNADQIRFRLAVRYMLVLFAIFLVIAWIVNNRIIMLGFAEFQWLSRIRDALFGLIAGLFSLTIWFGSEAWFHKKSLIILFRILGAGLFVMVLSALYFPLW